MVSPTLRDGQLLQALRNDAAYLFLSSLLIAFGTLAAALCVVLRRFNRLLLWLALFTFLDGVRLCLNTTAAALLIGPSASLSKILAVLSYFVPIPAFFFFQASGFLSRRFIQFSYGMIALLISLAVGTLFFGPLHLFYLIDSVAMSAALIALIFYFLRWPDAASTVLAIRFGLVTYATLVLCAYVGGLLGRTLRLEPVGFLILLASLGYVTAKTTFRRHEQLVEIESELEIARRIQLSLLPQDFPSSTDFQIAARYCPMTSVAGDFYEFLVAETHTVGLLIADVSGHGVPAALIASMVKLAATSKRSYADDPSRLLAEMNSVLCGNTQTQFVTAAYVYLAAELGELRYSAAAHPPMLLLRDGEVIALEQNGLMLAAFSFAQYSTMVHSLRPGDRLLLYTDGIVEAFHATGEEFGYARLCELMKESLSLSPLEAANLIISRVRDWAPSQDDDLTVIVCDYLPLAGTGR
jgi:sigma-B regulation protein RsbU (phosphoserine phosphatase)